MEIFNNTKVAKAIESEQNPPGERVTNYLFSSKELAIEAAAAINVEIQSSYLFKLTVNYDGCNLVRVSPDWFFPVYLSKNPGNYCRVGDYCMSQEPLLLFDPSVSDGYIVLRISELELKENLRQHNRKKFE